MRYHNKLYIKTTPQSSRDESGDFVLQDSQLEFACYCREESNNSGRKVSNGESSQIEYSFLIYTPQDCPEVIAGDQIEVQDAKGSMLKGHVLRFSRDRYNCRIWV